MAFLTESARKTDYRVSPILQGAARAKGGSSLLGPETDAESAENC